MASDSMEHILWGYDSNATGMCGIRQLVRRELNGVGRSFEIRCKNVG